MASRIGSGSWGQQRIISANSSVLGDSECQSGSSACSASAATSYSRSTRACNLCHLGLDSCGFDSRRLHSASLVGGELRRATHSCNAVERPVLRSFSEAGKQGHSPPLTNLFVSMLNAVDVPVKKFADSTGPMTEVLG